MLKVRDIAWFVRLNGEMIPEGIIDRTSAQPMLYLTCTMVSSVDLAHYGVSLTKDWVSVDCGTIYLRNLLTLCTCILELSSVTLNCRHNV